MFGPPSGITLRGGGRVTLDPIYPNAVPRLSPVRNVDNEIRGEGSIGLISNGGSVYATSGTLAIYSLVGSPADHTGSLGASAGGVLDVPGTLTGSGSWIADGGRIHVTGDVETSGHVSVVHAGTLAVATKMSGDSLIVDDTGSLDIQGALRIAGNVDFDGSNGGRWRFAPGASLEASRGGGAAVGDWGEWQFVEGSGRDLGLVAAGFPSDNV